MRRDRRRRRKVCAFCVDKIDRIDYKETGRLRRFLTERERCCPVVLPATAPGISGN